MQRRLNPQHIGLFTQLRRQVAQARYILEEEEQVWRGWRAAYALRCPAGHRFSASASLLLHRPIQCPACAQAARHAQLHALAAQRGGEYHGPSPENALRHRFTCRCGHALKMLTQ
ncbi:hypothetical protein [Chitiniphilus shinanonensis]|uniref:hypothetical protein n=1 Tax=Chitiniphilus shinanonensis TaxID=553088 RepID=UPI003034C5F9